jgi:predicted Zn-ribbon and HTH transcriptional regulator
MPEGEIASSLEVKSIAQSVLGIERARARQAIGLMHKELRGLEKELPVIDEIKVPDTCPKCHSELERRFDTTLKDFVLRCGKCGYTL